MNPSITYKLARPEDWPAVVSLLAQHTRDEPFLAACHVDTVEYASGIENMARVWLSVTSSIHIIAWDVANNVPVGMFLCFPFVAESSDEATSVPIGYKHFLGPNVKDLEAIENFFNELTVSAQVHFKYGVKRVLYLGDMCVNPSYRGQGIGTALLKEVLMASLEAGYEAAVTVGTSIVSQKVFEKNGFERILQVAYEDIQLPFRPDDVAEHKAAVLFTRLLQCHEKR